MFLKTSTSKRICALFLSLILALPLRAALPLCRADANEPFLAILHTNDVHGFAFAENDGQGQPLRLGYGRLKAIAAKEKARHVMLLDAGDVLHGQAFAVIRRGETIAKILARMDYAAIAAGNHDFDYGVQRLLELRDKYKLNFIAADVWNRADGSLLLPAYVIKDFEGFRAGIFGLSTPATTTGTRPDNIAGLDFCSPDDLAAVAARTVGQLRETEKADLVIALTHLGTEAYCRPDAQSIARRVPGIDLIVDGHSHSEVPGLTVNSTLIVSTGAFFKNLGRVELRQRPDGTFSLSSQLLPASAFAGTAPDPQLSSFIAELKKETDKESAVIVARLPFYLEGRAALLRRGESNLGRVVCAAMIRGTGADAALLNSGAVRGSIAAGEVSRETLISVFPFANYVRTVEMTGEDLLAALRHGLSRPGSGAFPQFMGLTVRARREKRAGPDGAPVESIVPVAVSVGGRPLDPTAVYSVAVNDFMAAGGDGYSMFTKYAHKSFPSLYEMLLDLLSDPDAPAQANKARTLLIGE
ncbi:MAG: bifunctional metallophosphatase/5'-nucleotidase [Desulfovibrio sp.]|nr:bifunctional metallophosphatase/5'-nucleotidase [Desulfovibrio sp.]